MQVHQQFANQVNLAAQPQAHVGGDLVVAAATGVQAFARIAHQLGQARLDVEVYVLQVQLPLKTTRFDLAPDLRHAFLNGDMVFWFDDALGRQHLGMCQTAGDVGLPKALVKEYAGGVAFDQITHGFRKQRRPRLGLFIELVLGHGMRC